MRRLILLCSTMLSITICLSSFFVIGYADSKKESILFRHIPWECSIEATLRLLKMEFGDKIKVSSDVKYMRFKELNKCELVVYEVSIPDLRVAGFHVEGKNSSVPNIKLYFIPELSEDQSSYKTDKGRLIGAEYIYINDVANNSGSVTRKDTFYINNDVDLGFKSVTEKVENELSVQYGSPSSKSGKWERVWKTNNAYIYGDVVETNVKMAATYDEYIKVSAYIPTGCSLVYAYQPESIISQSAVLAEIYNNTK